MMYTIHEHKSRTYGMVRFRVKSDGGYMFVEPPGSDGFVQCLTKGRTTRGSAVASSAEKIESDAAQWLRNRQSRLGQNGIKMWSDA